MKTQIQAIALSLLAPVCSYAEPETDKLNAWLDARYEAELLRSPMTLTGLGRKERYDELDDVSLAAEREDNRLLVESADEMTAQFDYDELDAEGRASYDFWRIRADMATAEAPYLEHGYVFDTYASLHTYPVTFLANYHGVESDSDMVAYIKRVGAFGPFLDQLVARAEQAAAKGIRPPRFAFDSVTEQSSGVISGAPFDDNGVDSPLWADGTTKIEALHSAGTIDQARAKELQAELKMALKNQLRPAYDRLLAWEKKDRANTSEEARGVWSLPEGDAYYRDRLRYYTHSDMTAEQVHNLGLSEVARIQEEMLAIKQQVKFEGDLKAFFDYVRDDSSFYYPNTDAGREAYLTDTRDHLAALEQRLPEYFGVLPKTPLVVKRVEPYRERDGGSQFYSDGTADGSRPGVYYIHMSDMSAYNRTDLETTAYHEGSPGHHMQISIAKEATGLPMFRTDIGYSAYWEGWGLYSEWLAKEMGAFKDPYNDFGRLTGEIWRAIRLVVDTGLHAKQWSEEQAVQYMLANSAAPEPAVRSEIRRYLVKPGQATSYKAGMLKIQALRAQAEQTLGDRFDIRGFHDTVLGGGAVPLWVLEDMVNDWVAKEQAAPGSAG